MIYSMFSHKQRMKVMESVWTRCSNYIFREFSVFSGGSVPCTGERVQSGHPRTSGQRP